jgi:hypothetical protein
MTVFVWQLFDQGWCSSKHLHQKGPTRVSALPAVAQFLSDRIEIALVVLGPLNWSEFQWFQVIFLLKNVLFTSFN